MLRASVVIPARDEADVIARCLRSAFGRADPGEFDVVVVCNACTDDTARIAGSFPGVRVVETDTPGKPQALDLGDDHAAGFPRVYLDADIEVDTDSLRAVVDALTGPGSALVAAPSLTMDMSGVSPAVRSFFGVWERLNYAQRGLIGAGFYALSEEGRARFARFPSIIADDLFVRELFSEQERRVTPGHFTFRPPHDLRSLLAVRVRHIAGNLEYADGYGGRGVRREGNDFVALVRNRPRLLPSVLLYLGVQSAAHLRAHRRRRSGVGAWLRDSSSRQPSRIP